MYLYIISYHIISYHIISWLLQIILTPTPSCYLIHSFLFCHIRRTSLRTRNYIPSWEPSHIPKICLIFEIFPTPPWKSGICFLVPLEFFFSQPNKSKRQSLKHSIWILQPPRVGNRWKEPKKMPPGSNNPWRIPMGLVRYIYLHEWFIFMEN